MKTALLIIATGEKYHPYIEPLLESACENFVKFVPILWTDSPDRHVVNQIYLKGKGFPHDTLNRYAFISEESDRLKEFDQLFYCDVDMRFVADVGEEIFSDGITATLHPGYVGTSGTPERRRESVAFISPLHQSKYFCGGFNGGDAKAFLQMAEGLASNIDFDTKHGITAVWHDESHLNWYLQYNKPAKILDPSYCYPENAGDHYLNKWKAAGINPTPKILALTKDER